MYRLQEKTEDEHELVSKVVLILCEMRDKPIIRATVRLGPRKRTLHTYKTQPTWPRC